MSDIQEFSELIAKITDLASESETYRNLQANLKALNEKIMPLMNPGPNGWALLTNEQRNELLEGYTQVGTSIQEYLREVQQQGPDHPNAKTNQNVSEMVNALAGFVREDTQMLRQYDPSEEPKSLPTLYEEARTVTLQPNGKQLQRMGGQLSSRIPVTIELNGKKVSGVFTRKETYDPAGTFNRIMQNAIPLIPARNREEGAALLNGLLNSDKQFKDPGPDVALDELGTNKGKVLAFMHNVLSVDQDGAYSINKDNLAKAIGYLSGKTAGQVKNILGSKALEQLSHKLINGEIVVNGNAKLPENANIGIRNVAMYRTAQLFGVPEVVCRSVPMKIKVGDQVVEGTFMEKADGIDVKNVNKTPYAIDRRPMDKCKGEGLRKAADLQVLDFICGNIDRHGANMFYQVTLNGKYRGVQGIDNDTSFGRLIPTKRQNRLLPVHQLQLVSAEMADKIMNTSDDQLRMTLHGLIEPECIDAAIQRLHMVQNQIGLSKNISNGTVLKADKNLPIIPIEKGNWGSPSVNKLLTHFPFAGTFRIVYSNMNNMAMRQNSILKDHPKFGTEVGSENRATEGGAFAQYDKSNQMIALMKGVTGVRGTSPNFEAMRQAVQDYRDYEAKLIMRMKAAKEKVKNGSTEIEDIRDQRINARDMQEMRKKLERIKETSGQYRDNKLQEVGSIDRANKYQRNRIETADLIYEFANKSLELSAEEKKTLNANQRRTTEDVIRQQSKAAEQKKDPEAKNQPEPEGPKAKQQNMISPDH
ncbi:MAG: hypothetical protein IJM83_03355 [Firmicutes bacterium]|nr:hypothetical protein [Bacillota bacterium]